MNIQQQLTEDMKQAMRDRDTIKLGAIRYLLSEIKNAEIDSGALDEPVVLKIIAKEIKQMQDAAEQFRQGNRPDLAQEEEQKIAVLQSYVPAQLSDAELKQLVAEVASTVPEKSMSALMPAVMAKVAGRADGKRVSQVVQQHVQ